MSFASNICIRMNVRHSRCISYFIVPLKHENIVWEVERNESLDDPIKRFCLYCYCCRSHHKSYSNADKWPINRLSMRCSLWIIRVSVIFKSFFLSFVSPSKYFKLWLLFNTPSGSQFGVLINIHFPKHERLPVSSQIQCQILCDFCSNLR